MKQPRFELLHKFFSQDRVQQPRLEVLRKFFSQDRVQQPRLEMLNKFFSQDRVQQPRLEMLNKILSQGGVLQLGVQRRGRCETQRQAEEALVKARPSLKQSKRKKRLPLTASFRGTRLQGAYAKVSGSRLRVCFCRQRERPLWFITSSDRHSDQQLFHAWSQAGNGFGAHLPYGFEVFSASGGDSRLCVRDCRFLK